MRRWRSSEQQREDAVLVLFTAVLVLFTTPLQLLLFTKP
jgi:hypothetical protein